MEEEKGRGGERRKVRNIFMGLKYLILERNTTNTQM